MVISELEHNGIRDIYAVPLEERKTVPRLMDSLHRADGMSFLDKGFILAFMFSTVLASKGFVWKWGPVIWGLIGAGIGFLLGILINWVQYKWKNHRDPNLRIKGPKSQVEVILIVTCEEREADLVEDILWEHLALGVAKTK